MNTGTETMKMVEGAVVYEEEGQCTTIRFVDANHMTLFHIPDGGRIKITDGYDGSERERVCHFLDETHMKIGDAVYHTWEFADRMNQNGHKYEPA